MSYAARTKVPIERSREEIERVLHNYGADEFFYGASTKGKGIGFRYKGRVIKIGIPIPPRSEYSNSQYGENKWHQEEQRRWRVLLIALKAKLELIDAGLTTFEDEFLAQTALPDGSSVGDWARSQIDSMIQEGKMPKLLPDFGEILDK
jgi:hypothetical protein